MSASSIRSSSAVVVATSPTLDGQTARGCHAAAAELVSRGVTVSFFHAADLPMVAPGTEQSGLFPRILGELVAAAERSQVVVFGARVVRGAVSGASRLFVELLRSALAGRTVVPVVAAGSPRAHLAAEAFRADLWLNFGARPTASIVVTDDLPDDELRRRLRDVLDDAFLDLKVARP